MMRPGAQRSTSSAGHASPPTSNAIDSKPSGDNIAAADGVWLRMSTFSESRSARNAFGEAATDSGTTTSRPPCSSAPKISQPEMSKLYECHCDHTRPGPVNRGSIVSISWATL
ncbi:Uncharacterised protein [Mycobacterium tuberculosis]|nr:Uncharacterised protein [Mycobacterium tuberculosis]